MTTLELIRALENQQAEREEQKATPKPGKPRKDLAKSKSKKTKTPVSHSKPKLKAMDPKWVEVLYGTPKPRGKGHKWAEERKERLLQALKKGESPNHGHSQGKGQAE